MPARALFPERCERSFYGHTRHLDSSLRSLVKRTVYGCRKLVSGCGRAAAARARSPAMTLCASTQNGKPALHDLPGVASSADDRTWSVLPCGHVYHTTCVAQHLEFKLSCPNCRVRTRLVTRLSPGCPDLLACGCVAQLRVGPALLLGRLLCYTGRKAACPRRVLAGHRGSLFLQAALCALSRLSAFLCEVLRAVCSPPSQLLPGQAALTYTRCRPRRGRAQSGSSWTWSAATRSAARLAARRRPPA